MRRRLAEGVRSPAAGAAALGALLLLVSWWWLAADHGMPVFDGGMHLGHVLRLRDGLIAGHELQGLREFTNYPPLVHYIGAVGALVGGAGTDPPVVAMTLVFVPLLVGGVYLAGSVAYGRTAGLVAIVFALGSPMLVPMLRVVMLDAPEAALVAAAVGLLLASDRFEKFVPAVAAGVACGLGLLTKQSFVTFVAGVPLVMLLRGGWRNWRGLLGFALPAAVIAAPWYVIHLDELRALVHMASAGGTSEVPGSVTPPRWSLKNVGYYVWGTVNFELLLPLTLLFVGSATAAVVRFARRRDRHDPTPELVVGALVGWLGMSWQAVHDPRYLLPEMVYFAVLGTAFVAFVHGRWRVAGIAAVSVVALINAAGHTFGVGPHAEIVLPGAPRDSPLGERHLTIVTGGGYVGVGGVRRQRDLVPLLETLRRRDGIRRLVWSGGAGRPAFNTAGISSLAQIARLQGALLVPGAHWSSHDAILLEQAARPGDRACLRLWDGRRLWIYRGDPSRGELLCPPSS